MLKLKTVRSVVERTPLLAGTVMVFLLVTGPHASQVDRSADADALEQLPSSPKSKIAINIGEGNGPPDSKVVLPVSVSAPQTANLGAVKIRLGFPKALLEFVEMELSGLALAAGAEVRTAIQPGPGNDQSVVEATISTVSPDGPRRALPVGRLGQLVFRIGKTAKPSTWISLTDTATASTVDEPSKSVPVEAYKTRIGVSLPPVSACFFYMH